MLCDITRSLSHFLYSRICQSKTAQMGLSCTVEKGLFRLNFFRLSFPTGGSSRKTWLFRLDLSVEKLSRVSITPVFEPIAYRSSHHKTHHTPIPGSTQQYHTTAPTLPWLSLMLPLAASHRDALLAPLASSVYHTTAVARVIDAILPTTATPAVALALSAECNATNLALAADKPNATNPLGRRFVAREARVAREERTKHRAANRFSTLIQQYSLTPTASRKSTKTIKSTRLPIRRRTRRIQSKKSPVEKGRFRLAESDCIRNGLSYQ